MTAHINTASSLLYEITVANNDNGVILYLLGYSINMIILSRVCVPVCVCVCVENSNRPPHSSTKLAPQSVDVHLHPGVATHHRRLPPSGSRIKLVGSVKDPDFNPWQRTLRFVLLLRADEGNRGVTWIILDNEAFGSCCSYRQTFISRHI